MEKTQKENKPRKPRTAKSPAQKFARMPTEELLEVYGAAKAELEARKKALESISG